MKSENVINTGSLPSWVKESVLAAGRELARSTKANKSPVTGTPEHIPAFLEKDGHATGEAQAEQHIAELIRQSVREERQRNWRRTALTAGGVLLIWVTAIVAWEGLHAVLR